jgi:hypothetical protein
MRDARGLGAPRVARESNCNPVARVVASLWRESRESVVLGVVPGVVQRRKDVGDGG